jgi:alginate O-acetyltransferase complex protein AlgJ
LIGSTWNTVPVTRVPSVGDTGERTQPISRHESWLPPDHPLYRPRHGKQRFALVCAVVFFLTPLVGLTLFGQPPSIENRAPHKFPSLSDGWDFFPELGPWAVDNLSFRESAIQAAGGISRGLFGEPMAQDGGDPSQPATGPIASAPVPGAPPLDNEPPPVAGYLRVILGKNNWLYFGYDTQGKCQPQQPLETVIGNLVKLRATVESSGRKFVLLVPPDKSTAVPENLPNEYPGKSCAAAYSAKFWSQVTAEAGAVDLRPGLERLGASAYFPQDTHWTYAGGLIMTRALAGAITPGVDLTWRVTNGAKFSGPADLPPMLAQTGTDQGMTYRLAPDGGVDRAEQGPFDQRDTVNFHTDSPVTGMVTGKTAMITDSFTNYAAPFLAATFSDVTLTPSAAVQQDPAAEAKRLVDSDTVVLEVVERNLAAGISPLTQPAVLAVLTQQLAAHPKK